VGCHTARSRSCESIDQTTPYAYATGSMHSIFFVGIAVSACSITLCRVRLPRFLFRPVTLADTGLTETDPSFQHHLTQIVHAVLQCLPDLRPVGEEGCIS